MNKKILLSLYSLLIVGLLIRAEVKTLPLLEKDLHFEKLKTPVKGSTLQYELSTEENKKAVSTYRGGPERLGVASVTTSDRFYPFQIKWKVAKLNNGIHRASKSSPAVDDSGFYIADDTGYLRAYDWNGKLLWQFYNDVSSRGFHSTPLTDSDSIYIGDYAGYFYGLNKQTGKIRWITKTGVTIGSSPFMHEGHLYVGVELADPNGYLLAIDAKSGNWLWTSPLIGNHPHSSPALDLLHKQILLGSNTGQMQAYELSTGKNLWSFQTKDDIKCAALIHKDKAYFVSWDGFFYALDSASGVLRWKTALDDGGMSCPSLSADGKRLAITGYKKNFVLNSESGQILWTSKIEDRNARAQASPLILSYRQQEAVIFLCEDKALCVHDLATGTVLQKIKLESTFSSSPVYYNGHLFLATSGKDGLLVLTQ
ncbi:PQQ-like beta-propeller repeat protein [uncultured Bdellovibrio sp.]|uniref:PQQ-like beta-propeller repeat protein n=1 Tax=Bdellovibrio sp. HCB-162 TaxID=3394234 RepID=UPI0025CD818A|nr:PQQ-like beta-propeller repeat protein [uncultured Bdellovibrio sp.]